MSRVIVAATQMACTSDRDENIATADGLVKELEVVLPVSFFEKKNQAHYNTVAMIDADGRVLGIYRKTHIPDGPG